MERKAIYSDAPDLQDLFEQGHEWNFHKADTKEHLHTLHPYPAKFIPQIARKAILEYSEPGDCVYDPFCGCGTTLLESSLLGRSSIGTDNNSVAILISRAKTNEYSKRAIEALERFQRDLPNRLRNALPAPELIPDSKNFAYWFNDEVMSRLSAIKKLILDTGQPEQTLLLAAFSAIIVKVSYQDSDTRYARKERLVAASDVDKAFASKLADTLSRLPDIILSERAQIDVHEADARSVPMIDSDSVSLVVTSPPYLNAYDYHKYHRQRIHWVDGDVAFSRDVEIGKHDTFTRPGATPDKYFTDMDQCFSEWHRVLKVGGKCLIIIGDAIVSKSPVPVADRFVAMLEDRGLRLEKRWIRELKSTQRSFNVRNSRMSHEHVMLFEKQ